MISFVIVCTLHLCDACANLTYLSKFQEALQEWIRVEKTVEGV